MGCIHQEGANRCKHKAHHPPLYAARQDHFPLAEANHPKSGKKGQAKATAGTGVASDGQAESGTQVDQHFHVQTQLIGKTMKKALFVLLLVSACLYASESEDLVRKLLSSDPDSRQDAAEQIFRSKNKRYIPSLLELAFYFTFRKDVQAYESLQDLLLKLSG